MTFFLEYIYKQIILNFKNAKCSSLVVEKTGYYHYCIIRKLAWERQISIKCGRESRAKKKNKSASPRASPMAGEEIKKVIKLFHQWI